jgi:hypothetical protein
LSYFNRIKPVADFTEMYHEYSSLLFYVGSAFLVYAVMVTFYRFRKPKRIRNQQ